MIRQNNGLAKIKTLSLRSWRYCWVSRAQAKAAKPRQRAAQPRVAWGGAARLSRPRRSLSRLRRLLVRAKPNNTASYAG